MTTERSVPQFTAPTWLRNTGFNSWLVVGFVLVLVGLIWLLDQTSTIFMPVLLATVLGAVAGPLVTRLEHHRVPRVWGALLVLIGLAAIGVLIFCLVVGGVSANSGDISAKTSHALDKIQGWLNDLGVDDTESVKEDVKNAIPEIRTTLLSGISKGISGLSSTLFFLAFAALSTLFVLKDGPTMRAFINRHMGLPVPTASIVTANVAQSLRNYFLAVTIIAAFNAVLIGGAALLLGVPLAGTIAVVTFVGAYIPFVGAWVSGAFAVLIALGTEGTDAALVLAVVALLANGVLQQVIQPFVMGATLSLNPLVVLIVTIGAGALFGMVGLMLAAPLTSAGVHISNEIRGRSNDPAASPRRRRNPAESGQTVVRVHPNGGMRPRRVPTKVAVEPALIAPEKPRTKESGMRGRGRATFAAILLLIAGTLNVVYGIGALDSANIFVNEKRFILTDLNTMGWVLIVIGVIQLTGGFSLIAGNAYGRVIGVIGGSLGAIGALFSIGGANPWWSLAVFFLCVWVVYGILVLGDDESYEATAVR